MSNVNLLCDVNVNFCYVKKCFVCLVNNFSPFTTHNEI